MYSSIKHGMISTSPATLSVTGSPAGLLKLLLSTSAPHMCQVQVYMPVKQSAVQQCRFVLSHYDLPLKLGNDLCLSLRVLLVSMLGLLAG